MVDWKQKQELQLYAPQCNNRMVRSIIIVGLIVAGFLLVTTVALRIPKNSTREIYNPIWNCCPEIKSKDEKTLNKEAKFMSFIIHQMTFEPLTRAFPLNKKTAVIPGLGNLANCDNTLNLEQPSCNESHLLCLANHMRQLKQLNFLLTKSLHDSQNDVNWEDGKRFTRRELDRLNIIPRIMASFEHKFNFVSYI